MAFFRCQEQIVAARVKQSLNNSIQISSRKLFGMKFNFWALLENFKLRVCGQWNFQEIFLKNRLMAMVSTK